MVRAIRLRLIYRGFTSQDKSQGRAKGRLPEKVKPTKFRLTLSDESRFSSASETRVAERCSGTRAWLTERELSVNACRLGGFSSLLSEEKAAFRMVRVERGQWSLL
jgi:hypothetical protein